MLAEDSIVINEINYNSADSLFPKDWVELYNVTSEPIDIGNWIFKDDNDEHSFPIPENYILLAGGYIVICDSLNAFNISFPDVDNAIGDFDFKLKNDGELIRLFDDEGELIDSVRFNDVEPWPVEADGDGPTLELINPYYDNALPSSWAASMGLGTPGQQNLNYIDCAGIVGGAATIDDCGLCTGGTTGNLANYLKDCAGECDGSAELDCANVCGGGAVIDACGDCGGDGSVCESQVPGCMDTSACNYNSEATFDNGSCKEIDCLGECGGSGLFDCAGDCDGNATLDDCEVCDGNNNTMDCNGQCNGSAVEDMCGTCDDNLFNDCMQDCSGDWGGTAIFDECGICTGGLSGISPCLLANSIGIFPHGFKIEGIYPNPFNPITTISFIVPTYTQVIITVYNIQGGVVASLTNSSYEPGYYQVVWNADTHSSGVYFVKMVAGSYVETQKIVLIN